MNKQNKTWVGDLNVTGLKKKKISTGLAFCTLITLQNSRSFAAGQRKRELDMKALSLFSFDVFG